jgi:hypothetical protein
LEGFRGRLLQATPSDDTLSMMAIGKPEISRLPSYLGWPACGLLLKISMLSMSCQSSLSKKKIQNSGAGAFFCCSLSKFFPYFNPLITYWRVSIISPDLLLSPLSSLIACRRSSGFLQTSSLAD